MGSSSGKTSRAETSAFLLILKANLKLQIMSSQALKATVQQSVRMASQVVEQQSRHGGGFVWRAGVGYQYQGGQGQHTSEQPGQVKDQHLQQGKEREGQFTQGLGWEHFYSSSSGQSYLSCNQDDHQYNTLTF